MWASVFIGTVSYFVLFNKGLRHAFYRLGSNPPFLRLLPHQTREAPAPQLQNWLAKFQRRTMCFRARACVFAGERKGGGGEFEE